MGEGRGSVRTVAAAIAVLGLLGGLLAFTAAPAGAGGGTVHVDTEAEFRSAWAQASVDEIILDATITLTCAGGTTPIRNSATAIIVDGIGNTLRNTCNNGTDHALMRSTGSGHVTLNDIVLTGGRSMSANGAGIQTTGSGLTVQFSRIIGNHAGPTSAGGGVASDGGDLDVFRTTFSGNSTTGGPGSAMAGSDSILIEESTVSGNLVTDVTDEAIATGGGTVTVTDSEIVNNQGTGFFAEEGSVVTRSTISGNGHRGVNNVGPTVVQESTVSGNASRGVSSVESSTVIRSTVHGNGERGVRSSGAVEVVQSTISNNDINVQSLGTLSTFGTVFATPTGASVNCDVTGAITELGDSVADDSSCGGDVAVETDPLGLGALQDNGGPTATRMLSATSPLLDVIPLVGCEQGPATGFDEDQRAFSRPGDDEGCDIGAVERCQDGTFSDVPLTSPFARDICWMGANGITTGFPNGTYKPLNSVTREAMSAFMYRLAGEPAFVPPGTPTFSDVPADSTFFLEIEWMAAEGITTGFPGGIYKPSDPVKRQSMSAFMYRLAGSPAFAPPGLPSFSDVGTGHPFYLEIEWMADEEITTGFNDGTYRPDDNVSRQAMSAFMRRLAEGPGVDV